MPPPAIDPADFFGYPTPEFVGQHSALLKEWSHSAAPCLGTDPTASIARPSEEIEGLCAVSDKNGDVERAEYALSGAHLVGIETWMDTHYRRVPASDDRKRSLSYLVNANTEVKVEDVWLVWDNEYNVLDFPWKARCYSVPIEAALVGKTLVVFVNHSARAACANSLLSRVLSLQECLRGVQRVSGFVGGQDGQGSGQDLETD